VTPSWGDSGFSLEPKSREDRKPTWPRVAVLFGILVLAFFVAKGCQDRDVDVTQEEAVEIANEQIAFEPTFTQVRFLRQGINRQGFWFVSLSQPIGFSGDRADLFAALAVVQIDSRTGDVTSVKVQSEEETREAKREARKRDQDEEVAEKVRELQASGEF
jgi:hypothetical protein